MADNQREIIREKRNEIKTERKKEQREPDQTKS